MSEQHGQPTIVSGSRNDMPEFVVMNVAAILGAPIQRWYGAELGTDKRGWFLRGRYDAGKELKVNNIYRMAPGEDNE